MGSVLGIFRSTIFMSVFFVALRVIGISWKQTVLIIISTVALMIFGLFWKFTAGLIALVFVWAVAISLGVAPSYPSLTGAAAMAQNAIQDNLPKVKEDISEMVKDNLPKVKDQVSHIVKDDIPVMGGSTSAGMAKPGSIEEQLQAIDLLAKSGAIKQEDADLIRGNLSEKASANAANSATPSK